MEDQKQLQDSAQAEIAASGAAVSLLVRDFSGEAPLLSYEPERQVPSASMIKTLILLSALERVRRGTLSLKQGIRVARKEILRDTEVFEEGEREYPLEEIAEWMIVNSDNTAANVLIELLGMEEINAFAQSLGLAQTALQRKMLDWRARRSGLDNLTSAGDQFRIFSALYRGSILTPELCGLALGILRRQRDGTLATRYLCGGGFSFAHKTGGLRDAYHDAGIFFLPERDYYFGCFVTDPKGGRAGLFERTAKKLTGRLSRRVFDYYRGES